MRWRSEETERSYHWTKEESTGQRVAAIVVLDDYVEDKPAAVEPRIKTGVPE